MNLVTLTVSLFGFGCFAAFSWGVKSHFRSTGAMPTGMKVTSGLSLAGFLWFGGRLATGPLSAFWPGVIALFAASLLLFAAAINASRKTPPTLAFTRGHVHSVHPRGDAGGTQIRRF
jgi:hypothetical protein